MRLPVLDVGVANRRHLGVPFEGVVLVAGAPVDELRQLDRCRFSVRVDEALRQRRAALVRDAVGAVAVS